MQPPKKHHVNRPVLVLFIACLVLYGPLSQLWIVAGGVTMLVGLGAGIYLATRKAPTS